MGGSHRLSQPPRRGTIGRVSDLPAIVMTFPSLDQAESALDWIGLEFAEGDGCFDGELAAGDAKLLDEVLGDEQTPQPVRALAAALAAALADLLGSVDDGDDGVVLAWRVAFTA